jgi:hypothetical protein
MTMGTPYTYSYPTTTTTYYSYPGTYAPGTFGYSSGYPVQPAVVATAPTYYGYPYAAGTIDYDGDGIQNSVDRFPADRSRW